MQLDPYALAAKIAAQVAPDGPPVSERPTSQDVVIVTATDVIIVDPTKNYCIGFSENGAAWRLTFASNGDLIQTPIEVANPPCSTYSKSYKRTY